MPHYNHGMHVGEALDAILSQSYQAHEIIIVDDASTDGSMSLLKEYCERYPQIKLFINEKNLGPARTINRCVQSSTGDYLVFCAADDRVLPGFFENLMTFMKENRDVALCTSYARYFTAQQGHKDDRFIELGDQPRIFTPDQLVEIMRKTSFYIPTHASIYRRKAMCAAGPLDDDLQMSSDMYINYKIAFSHNMGFVPKVLAAQRLSRFSYSAVVDKKRRARMFKALLSKIASEATRDYFLRSAFLAFFGIPMVIYLLARPLWWSFLPPILHKKIRNRLKRYSLFFIRKIFYPIGG
jgi:glycosyltransferase involved in cell wall biosynthesis